MCMVIEMLEASHMSRISAHSSVAPAVIASSHMHGSSERRCFFLSTYIYKDKVHVYTEEDMFRIRKCTMDETERYMYLIGKFVLT